MRTRLSTTQNIAATIASLGLLLLAPAASAEFDVEYSLSGSIAAYNFAGPLFGPARHRGIGASAAVRGD